MYLLIIILVIHIIAAYFAVYLLQEEWTTALVSAERSYSRKILAPFATFNLQEMKNFVPRSVCALDPQRYLCRYMHHFLLFILFFYSSSFGVIQFSTILFCIVS